jgi:hypothetical protein
MGSPSENVTKLKNAYRQWQESKGDSVKAWLDLERYFESLLVDGEMIHYTTGDFIAEGEPVAMRGSFYDTAALIAAAKA